MRPLTKLLEGPNAERYLRFALDRLEDLRRTGATFLSDVSEVGDATIQVKLLGDRDYIRIVVGGTELFASGYYGVPQIVTFSPPPFVVTYSFLANDPEYAYVRSRGAGFTKINYDEQHPSPWGNMLNKDYGQAKYVGSGHLVSLSVIPSIVQPDFSAEIKLQLVWVTNWKPVFDTVFTWTLSFAALANGTFLNYSRPRAVALGLLDAGKDDATEEERKTFYVGIASRRSRTPSELESVSTIAIINNNGDIRFSDIPLPRFRDGMVYGVPVIAANSPQEWVAFIKVWGQSLGSPGGGAPPDFYGYAVCTSVDQGGAWSHRFDNGLVSGWKDGRDFFDTIGELENHDEVVITPSGAVLISVDGAVSRVPNGVAPYEAQMVSRLFRADDIHSNFQDVGQSILSHIGQDSFFRIHSLTVLREGVIFVQASSKTNSGTEFRFGWDGDLFGGVIIPPSSIRYRKRMYWFLSKDDGLTWIPVSMEGFPYATDGAPYVGTPSVIAYGKDKSSLAIPVFDIQEGLYYSYRSNDDGATWHKWQIVSGAQYLWNVADYMPDGNWRIGEVQGISWSPAFVTMNAFNKLYLTRYRGKVAPFNIVTPWQTGEGKKPESQT